MGYHKTLIQKDILGKSSKLQEELDEFKDAEEQGNRILAICELADVFGALRAAAERYDLTMEDLEKMADATRE